MDFLSKYSIGIKIGKGFSGSVFECFCRNTGKKYACKIVSGLKETERNENFQRQSLLPFTLLD